MLAPLTTHNDHNMFMNTLALRSEVNVLFSRLHLVHGTAQSNSAHNGSNCTVPSNACTHAGVPCHGRSALGAHGATWCYVGTPGWTHAALQRWLKDLHQAVNCRLLRHSPSDGVTYHACCPAHSLAVQGACYRAFVITHTWLSISTTAIAHSLLSFIVTLAASC
jgi:hypothetical protein